MRPVLWLFGEFEAARRSTAEASFHKSIETIYSVDHLLDSRSAAASMDYGFRAGAVENISVAGAGKALQKR
jgi:hypothetical protein